MGLAGFQRRRRMTEGHVEQPAVEQLKESETPEQRPADAGQALADMTVKDLRALAADKGIALGRELTAKADILAAVEKALGES